MKIIDKTPFQDASGNISLIGRAQGILKYGLTWLPDLEAQRGVIAQLNRVLEKGFVLIRNFTLPDVDIVIPTILIGPGGIYVIYVTNVKGQFEAKGDQWNTIGNGRSQPAASNLLDVVMKRAKVVQKYMEFQKVTMPGPVEGVLIASNPGAHIDSLRPIVRVVMSDAIKQFAGSLLQARPIWRSDYIYDLADRIVEPPLPEKIKPEAPEVQDQPADRARAIFNAGNSKPAFNSSDINFALEEDKSSQGEGQSPQNLREINPSQRLPSANPASNQGRFFGLTTKQLILLGGMFVVLECLIVIGFAIAFFVF